VLITLVKQQQHQQQDVHIILQLYYAIHNKFNMYRTCFKTD